MKYTSYWDDCVGAGVYHRLWKTHLYDNPLPPLNNTVAFTGHLTFESDNAVPAVDGIWFLP